MSFGPDEEKSRFRREASAEKVSEQMPLRVRDSGAYVRHPTRGPDIFQKELRASIQTQQEQESPVRLDLEPREIQSQIDRASKILEKARAKRVTRGGQQEV